MIIIIIIFSEFFVLTDGFILCLTSFVHCLDYLIQQHKTATTPLILIKSTRRGGKVRSGRRGVAEWP